MGDDPFIKDFKPEIGVASELADGLRRIVHHAISDQLLAGVGGSPSLMSKRFSQ